MEWVMPDLNFSMMLERMDRNGIAFSWVSCYCLGLPNACVLRPLIVLC